MDGGCTFFWCGRGESERTEAEIGFTIRNSIVNQMGPDPTVVNNRIMTLHLSLGRSVYSYDICAYASPRSILNGPKRTFTTRSVPKMDKLIITGDFNARVRCD